MDQAFNDQAILLTAFRAQVGGRSPPADPKCKVRYITNNASIFKSVVKAEETKKQLPRPPTNRQKPTPRLIKNAFHGESISQKLSLRKPQLVSPKRRNFVSDFDKKCPVNKPETNWNFKFIKINRLICTDPKSSKIK